LSTINNGRHDIHIVHNGEKWHKIGNFFVIRDDEPPFIWAEDETGYTNESISLMYIANDPVLSGTIVALTTSATNTSALTVLIDQNNDDHMNKVFQAV
jgi:hypothetical protein